MNVMLFGAGASFGAGDIVPERPPLGKQLFGELARYSRSTWGSLPRDVDAAFREDFEGGMEVLWTRHSQMVGVLMQQMALYMVQFRPRDPGSTLYCSLAREIKRESATDRVLLSTVNYECVLEHALCGQGLTVSYGEFPSDGDVTIWKLHGSCNFLPGEGVRASRGVTFTRGVTFEPGVRPTGDLNEVVQFCLGDNALPPVMCLFMNEKPTQVAPSFVRAMQQRWQDAIGKAEKIAVVGVHPNAADAHLWNALADAKVLLYIGDRDAFANWAGTHRRHGKSEVVASTFEEGFDRLIGEIVR